MPNPGREGVREMPIADHNLTGAKRNVGKVLLNFLLFSGHHDSWRLSGIEGGEPDFFTPTNRTAERAEGEGEPGVASSPRSLSTSAVN